MIEVILITILFVSLHIGHAHNPKLRITLHFEYQPLNEKNEYIINLDGKLLQQFSLIDSEDPLACFEETNIELEKGKHKIEILFQDHGSQVIEKEFEESEEFAITWK